MKGRRRSRELLRHNGAERAATVKTNTSTSQLQTSNGHLISTCTFSISTSKWVAFLIGFIVARL
jgi:hypothetical protein